MAGGPLIGAATEIPAAVDGVQKIAKSVFPASEVYRNLGFPSLRVVTCGGPFDTTTRQYLDNVVVYAHLITSGR